MLVLLNRSSDWIEIAAGDKAFRKSDLTLLAQRSYHLYYRIDSAYRKYARNSKVEESGNKINPNELWPIYC